MIIAISGKINSGKNLTGDIIQYLLYTEGRINLEQFEKFRKLPFQKRIWSGCEQKSFAGKIKDIVCTLLGCTRDDLENREFKEKPLGKEWWFYRIVNTKQVHPIFKLISYLDNEGKYNESTIVKLSPRKILQLLGTEAGRNVIHPNIWCNALFVDYNAKSKQYGSLPYYYQYGNMKMESKQEGDYFSSLTGDVELSLSEQELIDKGAIKVDYELPNWIITDLRFPNELEAVKQRSGITIRINRPVEIIAQHQVFMEHPANYPEHKIVGEHSSETALDHVKDWDYVIDNDGTIEELIEKVKQILITEKLLEL